MYWVGSHKPIEEFITKSQILFEELEKYPENVKRRLNLSGFEGFILCAREDINASFSFGAFAHNGKYVLFDRLIPRTVYHELGHIFDYLSGDSSYFSHNNPVVKELFEKYDVLLSNTKSVVEFFADISDRYFLQPEALKSVAPDCYEYIKNFYESL